MEAVLDYTYLDDPFEEAPESGSTVPDGEYNVRVDAVEVVPPKPAHELGDDEKPKCTLKWDLIIEGGDLDGKRLWARNGIPVPGDTQTEANQKLGFLKKNLRVVGIDIESPDFRLSKLLSTGLDALLDRRIRVAAKTGKTGYQNVNFIEGLDADSAGTDPGSDKVNVFKDE